MANPTLPTQPSPRIATFLAALAYLTHPLSLAAAAVMLLNDGILRQVWPGWLTGKLSDLAWLFFVPFLVAAGLSWLLPSPHLLAAGFSRLGPVARALTRVRLGSTSRWTSPEHQESEEYACFISLDALRHSDATVQLHRRWTFALAFLLTGLAFSLVKSVPVFNLLATRKIERWLGIHPALRLDPSDLLALVGLALSLAWWLWTERRSIRPEIPLANLPRQRQTPRLAWVRILVLPLLILVLMGDAAAPDTGITCFQLDQGSILAKAGYQSYRSTDGGLTWQPSSPETTPNCTPALPDPGQWRAVVGPQPNQSYRYQSGRDQNGRYQGGEIQLTSDGGHTWQTAYRIPPVSQAEQNYLMRAHTGNPVFEPGPLDALADPGSGNMLFAMGLRGVLLHTAAGQWQWSMSGTYQRPGSFPPLDAFGSLLGGQFALAVGAALLICATLALRWTRRWPRVLVLLLAWLAWLAVDVLFPPAIGNSYLQTAALFGLLALAVFLVPLVIEQTFRLARRAPRALPTLALLALAAGLAYCVPYLLWLYNLLPDFGGATGAAVAAVVLILVIGLFAIRAFPKIYPAAPAALLALVIALAALSACSGPARGLQRWVTAAPSLTPFQPNAATPAAPSSTAAPPNQPGAAVPQATHQLQAVHRSGQTFLTWAESTALQGERYRVYRSSAPITADNLSQASRLAEVSKNSARFYGSMFVEDGVWKYRYAPRLITQDNGAPTPEGTGLLVWTVGPEDFGGGTAGSGYYAVTVTPKGGQETFSPAFTTGPVAEQVSDPLPVEITHSPGTSVDPQSRVFVQYMDLRHWNATYHAPNASNLYYGFDPADPDIAAALAYAYDYQVYEPTPETCGGTVPDKLPIMLFLHGARTNRYGSVGKNPYPHCAYSVYPIDQSDTWYFGFARDHDYRKNIEVSAGDVIENYTERRVLRMLYDLMRQPYGPAVDRQRVYVFGHSMGGSGTLGFVERYPNVFAAGYSGEPITNYRTSGVTKSDWVALVSIKWGAPALNLPIHQDAPAGWAQPLQKYNGAGVWDWQNYLGNLTGESVPGRIADEMAPFGVDHGINDDVIIWPTQGQVFYPAVAQMPRVWSGAVTPARHEWSDFGWPLPSLAKQDGHPFWNLQVKRDETLPALSHVSSNLSGLPDAPTSYNQTIKWSSSWDAWDKAPVDQPDLWQMSFCAVQAGSTDCGSGQAVTASVTPRRLQQFKVQPGQTYDWENRQVSDNGLVAKGSVTAGADGLVTVPGFVITPAGNRLVLRLHK